MVKPPQTYKDKSYFYGYALESCVFRILEQFIVMKTCNKELQVKNQTNFTREHQWQF